LRTAFVTRLKDPKLLAEAKKKHLELDPSGAEDLETLAKDVMSVSPDAAEQLNKLNELPRSLLRGSSLVKP
jgi:hypothetical protein